jgi:hypothetical protein
MEYNQSTQHLRECTFCRIELPIYNFYKDDSLPSGYQSKCKKCIKETKELKLLIPTLNSEEKFKLFNELYFKRITVKSLMNLFDLSRPEINNIVSNYIKLLYCKNCNEFLDYNDFYNLINGQYDNKHYSCKWCLKTYSSDYYLDIKENRDLIHYLKLKGMSNLDILYYLHFDLAFSFRKCSIIFNCEIKFVIDEIIKTNLKRCSMCGEIFTRDHFTKMLSASDKLSCSCKYCNRDHNREYYNDHRGEHLLRTRILKTGRFIRTPNWANMDEINKIYKKSKEISLTTGIVHHVDHIIPLHGKTVSGLHVESNLQIIEAFKNSQKYNSFIDDDIV